MARRQITHLGNKPSTARPEVNILMDSGAYTAWRSGKPIVLQNYIDFLKSNLHWITEYAALDVINPEDPEAAARDSMTNYKEMRRQGLSPIPIFHVGEDLHWLKDMLDIGADYIGLSASSIVSRGAVDHWYDLMWSHLCDTSGRPMVRCHAFGEGREGTLRQGPWRSADTASWLYGAQRNASFKIGGANLSNRHDRGSSKSSPDIDALEGYDALQLKTLLAAHSIKEEALSRDKHGHISRSYLLALHYLAIQTRVREEFPILFHRTGFMGNPLVSRPPLHIDNFNLYLVIGTNATGAVAAYRAGVRNMLVSYAHLPLTGARNVKTRVAGKLDQFALDPERTLENEEPYSKYNALLKGCMNA